MECLGGVLHQDQKNGRRPSAGGFTGEPAVPSPPDVPDLPASAAPRRPPASSPCANNSRRGPRNGDDPAFWKLPADAPDALEAFAVGHHQVGDDRPACVFPQCPDGLLAIARGDHLVSLARQDGLEQASNPGVVIHHQDSPPRVHCSPNLCEQRSRAERFRRTIRRAGESVTLGAIAAKTRHENHPHAGIRRL